MAEPREAVRRFAEEMERKLGDNDGTKADWSHETNAYLLGCLREEVDELEGALLDGDDQEIIDEASDVANMAMMLADKCMAPLSEPHGRGCMVSAPAALAGKGVKPDPDGGQQGLYATVSGGEDASDDGQESGKPSGE